MSSEYQLLRTIHAGTHSKVLVARRLATGQEVVLKLVEPSFANKIGRSWTEVVALSKLHHENISVMNRSGVTEKGDWLIELSYVDGETLASLLQDGASRMSLALRLQALESLASALSYIHFVGWLHGDLSPQNILFDRIRGKGILIDYGHSQPIDSIVRPSRRLHSLEYASPEEKAGKVASKASEYFAFGKIAAEILPELRLLESPSAVTSSAKDDFDELRATLVRTIVPDESARSCDFRAVVNAIHRTSELEAGVGARNK